MVYQIYATVEGAKQGAFKGETLSSQFRDRIPLVAFNYGVVVPHDSASGQSSGKRQHEPVVITKEWGASSPQFFAAAYDSEVLKSVLIEFVSTGSDGKDAVDHTVALTNSTIVSVSDSIHLGQPGGPVVDTRELTLVSLTFQKIEIDSICGKTQAVDDWLGA